MPVDFAQVRLGRREHDPARVAAVEPHLMAASVPTPLAYSPNIIWTPSLVQNDVLPTCTVAGMMNSARVWALRHGFDLVNVESNLLAFYASISGCADNVSAIQATDGLVMLDVVDRANAGKFDVGEQAALIPRAKRVDITSLDQLKAAIFLTGCAYVGVSLRQADVQQGAVWQGNTENAGDPVGGHCIILYGYTTNGFTAATWGGTIEADNEWLTSRLDEAYALVWTFPVSA